MNTRRRRPLATEGGLGHSLPGSCERDSGRLRSIERCPPTCCRRLRNRTMTRGAGLSLGGRKSFFFARDARRCTRGARPARAGKIRVDPGEEGEGAVNANKNALRSQARCAAPRPLHGGRSARYARPQLKRSCFLQTKSKKNENNNKKICFCCFA